MIRKIMDILEARPVEEGFFVGTAVIVLIFFQLPLWAAVMGAGH